MSWVEREWGGADLGSVEGGVNMITTHWTTLFRMKLSSSSKQNLFKGNHFQGKALFLPSSHCCKGPDHAEQLSPGGLPCETLMLLEKRKQRPLEASKSPGICRTRKGSC